jgi:hypothetical protein
MFMKEYFEKIFEGIYINENIIGIMNLLLNKKEIKDSPIINMNYNWTNDSRECKCDYNESNIFYRGDKIGGFNQTIIYDNFYKHYLSSSNPPVRRSDGSNAVKGQRGGTTETAKIENLYSFFVTANISKNQKIKEALIKNADISTDPGSLSRNNYIDELCDSQIKMFKDFEDILHAINPI